MFLKGKRINLRPLSMLDISGSYKKWLNDQEVVLYNSHGRFPMTHKKLENYVMSTQVSTNMIVLAIEDEQTQKHIGNISLQSINWIDRSAEIAFLLGETNFSGKGIMFEAGQLMLNHGFNTLNLHRIYCGTSSANIGMQKLANKLNFKKEGIRREAIFNEGSFHDIIEYGLLKNEF